MIYDGLLDIYRSVAVESIRNPNIFVIRCVSYAFYYVFKWIVSLTYLLELFILISIIVLISYEINLRKKVTNFKCQNQV